MKPFREDPRFEDLADRLGFTAFRSRRGSPDYLACDDRAPSRRVAAAV